MNLLGKSIDQLYPADIQSLKDNSVAESMTIDYKLMLHGNADQDKRELCADISSFANTAGGHLIYGIDEAGGVPTAIPGLSGVDRDKELLRIEQILRSGLDPRLPSVTFKWIDMPGAGTVLVVSIGRSWQAPHMVTLGGVSRFYARHSSGKFPMGVSEIRSAMLQAESGRALFTRWRNERVALLLADEGPSKLSADNGKVVLHVVPFASSLTGYSVDVHALRGKTNVVRPMCSSGWGDRYNADGIFSYAVEKDRETGYVQYFRDGRVEIVDATMLAERQTALNSDSKRRYLPNARFEEQIIDALKRTLEAYRVLSVEPPFVVMLTLVNAKGFQLGVSDMYDNDDARPLDRDILACPDFVWNDVPGSVETAAKPIFDLVWNAFGWAGSINYDDKGQREVRR